MQSKSALSTTPVWLETPLPTFAPLERDLNVDVVVVGGGVTGITTAYLLKSEGATVALLERGSLASADSGHTTAHLTYVTDYRLNELVRQFGNDGARTFWEAGASAINQIEAIVAQTGADADFRRVPGYLHMSRDSNAAKELPALHEDADLANRLGFDAKLVDAVPLFGTPGIRFENQAKIHPSKYLRAMLRALAADGCHIFEHSEMQEVSEKPLAVTANGRRIRCDYIVIATHNPLMGKQSFLSATLFQTKLSLYTSYVLGAEVAQASLPEALFWDTSDPYDYWRVDSYDDHQYVIFGGEDVKTGQEDAPEAVFDRLRARLKAQLPSATVTHRWLGQVVETDDGLPFIGENSRGEFIATGYCGNGYTLSTAAAMMARDRFLARPNPWFDLFKVDRKPFHGGVWRYLAENIDYPIHLVKDRLKGAEGTLADVRPGEGRIVALDGKKVAAYRDANGGLALCSPVCTHMKCLVRWNDADGTWDCPCHGSRFHTDGTVHSGPAESPLDRIELPADEDAMFADSKAQPPSEPRPPTG